MKILVIDDNPNNIASALQTLKGHEVTTCSDYYEAQRLFSLEDDYKEYLPRKHDTTLREELREFLESYSPYQWDAVLCDYLMPAHGELNGSGKTEKPVGLFLAFFAAQYGAKYIAVVSNMDFHDKKGSSEPFMCQQLMELESDPFTIRESKVFVITCPPMVQITGTENKGKDWSKILEALVNNSLDLLYK